MQESELLSTFAEVAVAFVGFASLVSILGRQSARDDPRVNSVRMRAMVLYSLTVVVFSLSPLVLERYGFSSVGVWRAISPLFAVTVAATIGWLLHHSLRLRSVGAADRRTFLILATVPLPVLASAALLLLANATVVAAESTAAVYLTGLGLLLFQACFAFGLVLFSFLGHGDLDR